jgi:hypothetical protein
MTRAKKLLELWESAVKGKVDFRFSTFHRSYSKLSNLLQSKNYPQNAIADEKHTRCMEQAFKISRCCKLPEFEDESAEECRKEATELSTNEHEGGMCYMDCIFKKNELIDDSGEMDKEKILEVSDKYLENAGESDLKELVDESIETCFGKCEFLTWKIPRN